jgi:acyl carrier protein
MDVEAVVIELITAQFASDPKKQAITVDSGTDIIADLGADSLDMVEIVLKVEERFNLEIPDKAFEDWSTVGDAVHYVRQHYDNSEG